MEATKRSSYTLPYQPLPSIQRYRKRPLIVTMASSHGGKDNRRDFYQGKLVDESMIELRMRIKEIKASEKLPDGWMEWEKRYFVHYNANIIVAVGLLQNFLMNVRPSVGLGMMALVMLSLPVSTWVILFHAAEFAKGFISGFIMR
ncbi:hypothetical protein SLEP1_g54054 [Rubroshorea leprosula]|uniref:PRA1 family protein n=1 Tax=Rubroshorea leprosula TaxID=152421 RepID=A0AAV5MBE0_9ROSI|nr:hypothetical protein SLEP1_g54054 [Rubroshorea leprosula]